MVYHIYKHRSALTPLVLWIRKQADPILSEKAGAALEWSGRVPWGDPFVFFFLTVRSQEPVLHWDTFQSPHFSCVPFGQQGPGMGSACASVIVLLSGDEKSSFFEKMSSWEAGTAERAKCDIWEG